MALNVSAQRLLQQPSSNTILTFLSVYASFLEWNSSKEITEAAESFYTNVENLEFCVGLQAEEVKKPGGCWSLSWFVLASYSLYLVDHIRTGYAISRAIPSDAISLMRGDSDCTPYNLTAWGFVDCQRDLNQEMGVCLAVSSFTLCLRSSPTIAPTHGSPSKLTNQWRSSLTSSASQITMTLAVPFDTASNAIAKECNNVQQIFGSAQFRQPYGDKGERIVSGKG